MNTEKRTVLIGIPTYRRPKSLRLLLDSIAHLKKIDAQVMVVVADNQGVDGLGLQEINNERYKNYPFELQGIAVKDVGISYVRNALLDFSFNLKNADGLAMVDDDEIVDENWLSELYRVHSLERFDVVGGAVYPKFTIEAPAWTNHLHYYWRPVYETGSIELIQGTTNVYISRTVWDKLPGAIFDTDYGKSGGEDKEFFTRLKKHGATFAFAQKAISHEWFDESRLTYEWVEMRAYRIGCSDARSYIKNKGYFSFFIKEMPKVLLAITFSKFKVAFCSKQRRIIYKLLYLRQVGKIQGALGNKIDVYSRTYGG